MMFKLVAPLWVMLEFWIEIPVYNICKNIMDADYILFLWHNPGKNYLEEEEDLQVSVHCDR